MYTGMFYILYTSMSVEYVCIPTNIAPPPGRQKAETTLGTLEVRVAMRCAITSKDMGVPKRRCIPTHEYTGETSIKVTYRSNVTL